MTKELPDPESLLDLPVPEGGRSALATYMRDMAALPARSLVEEQNLSQGFITAELDRWALILTHPPTTEAVERELLKVLNPVKGDANPLPTEMEPLAALRMCYKKGRFNKVAAAAKWAEVTAGLPKLLRKLDIDREAVTAVEAQILEAERLNPEFRSKCRAAMALVLRRKNRFVEMNLPLVVSVARRYNKGTVPLEDLIQDGNIGLFKAVERYDPDRGFRFSTYACWWIRHMISRSIADKGRAVRLPVHLYDDCNRAKKGWATLQRKLGRAPTMEEIAEQTGMALPKVQSVLAQDWTSTILSLDVPQGGDEEGKSLLDLLAGEAPAPSDELEDE